MQRWTNGSSIAVTLHNVAATLIENFATFATLPYDIDLERMIGQTTLLKGVYIKIVFQWDIRRHLLPKENNSVWESFSEEYQSKL